MRRGKVGLTLGEDEKELPSLELHSTARAGREAGGASRSAWTGVAACRGAGDPPEGLGCSS